MRYVDKLRDDELPGERRGEAHYVGLMVRDVPRSPTRSAEIRPLRRVPRRVGSTHDDHAADERYCARSRRSSSMPSAPTTPHRCCATSPSVSSRARSSGCWHSWVRARPPASCDARTGACPSGHGAGGWYGAQADDVSRRLRAAARQRRLVLPGDRGRCRSHGLRGRERTLAVAEHGRPTARDEMIERMGIPQLLPRATSAPPPAVNNSASSSPGHCCAAPRCCCSTTDIGRRRLHQPRDDELACEQHDEGIAIMITTHDLNGVAAIAALIALHRTVIADGAPPEFHARHLRATSEPR